MGPRFSRAELKSFTGAAYREAALAAGITLA
jgi:hypothetical protein